MLPNTLSPCYAVDNKKCKWTLPGSPRSDSNMWHICKHDGHCKKSLDRKCWVEYLTRDELLHVLIFVTDRTQAYMSKGVYMYKFRYFLSQWVYQIQLLTAHACMNLYWNEPQSGVEKILQNISLFPSEKYKKNLPVQHYFCLSLTCKQTVIS